MKGFNTFDTTNKIYGEYYTRKQDPITNIPVFQIPEDEEQFYQKTLEMRKNYFDRYAHLYKDNKSCQDNKIDSKPFKEEFEPLQKPYVLSHETPERSLSQTKNY